MPRTNVGTAKVAMVVECWRDDNDPNIYWAAFGAINMEVSGSTPRGAVEYLMEQTTADFENIDWDLIDSIAR